MWQELHTFVFRKVSVGFSALVFTLPVELWKRSTLKEKDASPQL